MVAEDDHDAVPGVISELVAHGHLLRQRTPPVDDPWGQTYDWARRLGRLSEPVLRALCVYALQEMGADERRHERHLTRQDVRDAFERGLIDEADVLAAAGFQPVEAGEAGLAAPSAPRVLPPARPLGGRVPPRPLPPEAVQRRPPVDLGVLRGFSCAVNGRDISMARMTLRLWERAGQHQKATLLGQYTAWAQWSLVADLVRGRGAGPDDPWERYVTEQEAAYLIYCVETAQPNMSAMLEAGLHILENDNPLFRYAPGPDEPP